MSLEGLFWTTFRSIYWWDKRGSYGLTLCFKLYILLSRKIARSSQRRLHFSYTVKHASFPKRKHSLFRSAFFLEASPRLELGMRILQTLALPLGYDAVYYTGAGLADDCAIHGSLMERETGFGPATFTLARWHSTTESLPQNWLL